MKTKNLKIRVGVLDEKEYTTGVTRDEIQSMREALIKSVTIVAQTDIKKDWVPLAGHESAPKSLKDFDFYLGRCIAKKGSTKRTWAGEFLQGTKKATFIATVIPC